MADFTVEVSVGEAYEGMEVYVGELQLDVDSNCSFSFVSDSVHVNNAFLVDGVAIARPEGVDTSSSVDLVAGSHVLSYVLPKRERGEVALGASVDINVECQAIPTTTSTTVPTDTTTTSTTSPSTTTTTTPNTSTSVPSTTSTTGTPETTTTTGGPATSIVQETTTTVPPEATLPNTGAELADIASGGLVSLLLGAALLAASFKSRKAV